MPMPKIDEVRSLSDGDLAQQVADTKKQLFDLRLQQATGQLETPHQFKHLRHRLAQLLTVERERELQQAAEAAATPSTPEPAPTATPEPTPDAEAAATPEPEPAAASDTASDADAEPEA